MSSIQYTKLFSIQVIHDYYLFNNVLLSSYNILEDLDFIPMPSTVTLLRNLKCVFKKNAKGFDVYARADGSKTFVYIAPTVKFQFMIVVKNPYFFNFTNLRLTENTRKLYRFANTAGATDELTFPFLHKKFRASDDSTIEFGDLVLQNNRISEAITNASPDNQAQFIEFEPIGTGEPVRYVTVKDRINWQYPTYRFSRNGLPAKEIVSFELRDENGNIQELGNIPNTGTSQAQAIASNEGKIDHVLNLSQFPSGIYTLTAKSSTKGTDDERFYLLDSTISPNAFGVIELYADTALDQYNFLTYSTPNESTVVTITNDKKTKKMPKVFEIRFKNRTTVWKYFNVEKLEITNDTTRPRRALTKQLSNFTLDGIRVPDPSVAFIYPELSDKKVNDIFSEIYLNQSQS